MDHGSAGTDEDFCIEDLEKRIVSTSFIVFPMRRMMFVT